jgi:hypothetical protein
VNQVKEIDMKQPDLSGMKWLVDVNWEERSEEQSKENALLREALVLLAEKVDGRLAARCSGLKAELVLKSVEAVMSGEELPKV